MGKAGNGIARLLRRLRLGLGDRAPHGDELLGRGRVDADGGVEIRLGGARFERHGEALDDLAGFGAQHVDADDFVAVPIDGVEITWQTTRGDLDQGLSYDVDVEGALSFSGTVDLLGPLGLRSLLKAPREAIDMPKEIPKEIVETLIDSEGNVNLAMLIEGTSNLPKVDFDRETWKKAVGKRVEDELKKELGKKLGDLDNPLLLSVRSGARESMPGMMDTVLNLGINDKVVEALAAKTGNAKRASGVKTQ